MSCRCLPGAGVCTCPLVVSESFVCRRCNRRLPREVINVEARVHHGAGGYECIDRKACERARRKSK